MKYPVDECGYIIEQLILGTSVLVFKPVHDRMRYSADKHAGYYFGGREEVHTLFSALLKTRHSISVILLYKHQVLQN